MYTCKLALVAEKIIVDERRSMASAINILEEINAQSLPLLITSVEGFFLLYRQDQDLEEADCSLVIKENEVIVFRTPLPCNFNSRRGVKLIFEVRGIPVQQPGTLSFILEIVGIETARYDLPVKVYNVPDPQISFTQSIPH